MPCIIRVTYKIRMHREKRNFQVVTEHLNSFSDFTGIVRKALTLAIKPFGFHFSGSQSVRTHMGDISHTHKTILMKCIFTDCFLCTWYFMYQCITDTVFLDSVSGQKINCESWKGKIKSSLQTKKITCWFHTNQSWHWKHRILAFLGASS